METGSTSSVKALTAMFAERKEPVMGIKSTLTTKSPESQASAGKASLPRGPKPPIKTQKPILPKPMPRKPPRLKSSNPDIRKSFNSLNVAENEHQSSRVSKSYSDDVDNNNTTKSLKPSRTKSQSYDSLNTVCTNDSGISSNLRLDAIIDKTLHVSNDLYNFNNSSNEINQNSITRSPEVTLDKESIKKELELRLGSQNSLKSSCESLTSSCKSSKNSNSQYPYYRRVMLSELSFERTPPRKPMLPPDVHIAVFKQVETDSPPPAPPRRLSNQVNNAKKFSSAGSDLPPELQPRTHPGAPYVRPSRIVPSRPSPPPPVLPKFSLPTNGYASLRQNCDAQDHSESNNVTNDFKDQTLLIPEYTEEEELSDNVVYDDTGMPPPLPQKPPRSISVPKNSCDPDNGNLVSSSLYQSPVKHVLPTDHPLNTDHHYSIPRDHNLDSKEGRAKFRKEQKHKEKKEKDFAKFKKKYSLTGEEKPLDFGFIKESARGRRNDLSVRKGEKVFILRMDNNPAGMWLVQNINGKMGYVELTNIEVEPEYVKSVMLSCSQSRSLDSNLNIEEDDYDDIEAYYTDDAIYEETF